MSVNPAIDVFVSSTIDSFAPGCRTTYTSEPEYIEPDLADIEALILIILSLASESPAIDRPAIDTMSDSDSPPTTWTPVEDSLSSTYDTTVSSGRRRLLS